MIHSTLPEQKRDCPARCGKLLNYYKEGSRSLDLYYCEKCYLISEYDGKNIIGTLTEAYPNRVKPLNNEGMEWEKELEAIRKTTAEAFEGQSWFLAWNERLIERIALFLSLAKQEGVEEGSKGMFDIGLKAGHKEILEVAKEMSKNPEIGHGMACERGKRPCGITHSNDPLHDRCETYPMTIEDLLNRFNKS